MQTEIPSSFWLRKWLQIISDNCTFPLFPNPSFISIWELCTQPPHHVNAPAHYIIYRSLKFLSAADILTFFGIGDCQGTATSSSCPSDCLCVGAVPSIAAADSNLQAIKSIPIVLVFLGRRHLKIIKICFDVLFAHLVPTWAPRCQLVCLVSSSGHLGRLTYIRCEHRYK